MRAVAGKDDVPMDEARHASTLEGVDAVPLAFEGDVGPEQAADQRLDILRLDARLPVDVPAELKIEPPDVVGLFVEQRRLPAVERRVEPEPALGREITLHANVGDEEIILEDAPVEVETERFAHGRLAPVAGDQPVAFDVVGTSLADDRKTRAVCLLDDRIDAMSPAQFDIRVLRECGDQSFLDMILLYVDEGGKPLALVGQQVELINGFGAIAPEHLADIPHHALVDHRFGDPESVPNLEAALGEADGLGTGGNERQPVEDQHVLTAPGQVECKRQPDRTGANDDYATMLCRGSRGWRVAKFAPHRDAAGCRHPLNPATAPIPPGRARRSRCAASRCRRIHPTAAGR